MHEGKFDSCLLPVYAFSVTSYINDEIIRNLMHLYNKTGVVVQQALQPEITILFIL